MPPKVTVPVNPTATASPRMILPSPSGRGVGGEGLSWLCVCSRAPLTATPTALADSEFPLSKGGQGVVFCLIRPRTLIYCSTTSLQGVIARSERILTTPSALHRDEAISARPRFPLVEGSGVRVFATATASLPTAPVHYNITPKIRPHPLVEALMSPAPPDSTSMFAH